MSAINLTLLTWNIRGFGTSATSIGNLIRSGEFRKDILVFTETNIAIHNLELFENLHKDYFCVPECTEINNEMCEHIRQT